MAIKNLKLNKRQVSLILAGAISISLVGCSNNIKESDTTGIVTQTATSFFTTYTTLDWNKKDLVDIVSLSDGEKRGILLSNEPCTYDSLFIENKNKIYLSDQYGNRITANFDDLKHLSNYRYLTEGGMLLGDWKYVEADCDYDFFVGSMLGNTDEDPITRHSTTTLLDKNGLELCSFKGYFVALIENTIVVREYFDGKEESIGKENTYLYDYNTNKKGAQKHDYVEIVTLLDEQNNKVCHLVGVNWDSNNTTYFFYDKEQNIIATVNEKEIENWYIENDNYYDFYKNNYNLFYEKIYNTTEKEYKKQLSHN